MRAFSASEWPCDIVDGLLDGSGENKAVSISAGRRKFRSAEIQAHGNPARLQLALRHTSGWPRAGRGRRAPRAGDRRLRGARRERLRGERPGVAEAVPPYLR